MKATGTVHELVAVFKSADDLQEAMDDLWENGFAQHELSLLASEKAVREKLGRVYRRIEEAADDPDAPRTIFVSNESMGNAIGTAIGLPLYIAATTATGIVVASGGTLLAAILAAAAAGTGGAAIGAVLAGMISRHHAEYIREQIDLGGLLLWVHLRAPEMERKAADILARHAAVSVHAHEIQI
ncbi:MAG: hypothetical protein KGL10_05755 [Alphaproteobacteria bacterium]|nr:hypothetical protein [Alphaproteobacteria bacterium]MDE2336798.1 hypothetical protein [Alphaproteobacteria bacterium]